MPFDLAPRALAATTEITACPESFRVLVIHDGPSFAWPVMETLTPAEALARATLPATPAHLADDYQGAAELATLARDAERYPFATLRAPFAVFHGRTADVLALAALPGYRPLGVTRHATETACLRAVGKVGERHHLMAQRADTTLRDSGHAVPSDARWADCGGPAVRVAR